MVEVKGSHLAAPEASRPLHTQLGGGCCVVCLGSGVESRVGERDQNRNVSPSSGFTPDLPCVLSYSAESGQRLFK